MEPVCSICGCRLTDENKVCYMNDGYEVCESFCKKCKEKSLWNRHEKRKEKALRRSKDDPRKNDETI